MTGMGDEIARAATDDWQLWAERELWPNCDLDLGADHRLQFIYQGGELCVGAFLVHRKPEGLLCLATVAFDVPGTRWGGAKWTVNSWKPLTVYQSVLCHGCNDHGFIRENKWVKAG